MSLEENEALTRRWFAELWNAKRTEIIEELMTEETIAHGMGPNGTSLKGIAPFRAAYDLFVGAFPDLTVTIDQLVVTEDRIATHLTCEGTHTGDHLGVPASGKTVRFPAMTMARLQDGKIVEGWNVIDLLAAFNQIGSAQVSEKLP